MKKITKKVAIALTALLAVSAAAGCGGNSSNNETSTTTDGGKRYTYWTAMPAAIATQYSTMAEMAMYQELEKRTGVTIDFIHPPIGQEGEQFNLMIASRDLPDIIESSWGTYPGGPEKAVTDGIALKLNDKLEEHAPNLKKALDSNPLWDRQTKTDEGTYYGFPGLCVGTHRTFGGILIRKDWLDDLGLEMPETIDDWENVLRQFKEKKGATAPFTGFDNLFAPSYGVNAFNGAYNVGLGFYMKDGKVTYGPIEPEYKEFIARMNKWYEEGLLDKEYASNDGNLVDAKMTDGSSGALYGYIGSTIGRYMSAMEDRDPNYNLVAVQHPVGKKGEEPYFMELSSEAIQPFMVVTTAAKDPDGIMEWADYLYTEEGELLVNFGVEGLTYNMVDGVPTYTDLILHNPEGLSISEAMARYFRASGVHPGYNQNDDYLNQYYQLPQQKEALDVWSKYAENARTIALPPATVSGDEADEIATLLGDIDTYVRENIYKFVHGEKPMSEYDNFVNDLKKMKIDRAIEINQNAVDRYNAR